MEGFTIRLRHSFEAFCVVVGVVVACGPAVDKPADKPTEPPAAPSEPATSSAELTLDDVFDDPPDEYELSPEIDDTESLDEGEPVGGMVHTPVDKTKVGLPFVVVARVAVPFSNAALYYRDLGEHRFAKISMAVKGERVTGRIPPPSSTIGHVSYYVEAYDADGNVVAHSGSEFSPHLLNFSEPPQEPQPDRWEPLLPGSRLKVLVTHQWYPLELKLSSGTWIRGEGWKTLKPFLLKLPESGREAVLQALTLYWVEWDKVDGVFRFAAPRAGRLNDYDGAFVSFQGTIKERKASAFLHLRYEGHSWLFADSVTVFTDGKRMEFAGLAFSRDNYGDDVWEDAFLNYSKARVREAAERIASSKEAIVRFRGKSGHFDLTVTEPMKEDLRLMISALRVLK